MLLTDRGEPLRDLVEAPSVVTSRARSPLPARAEVSRSVAVRRWWNWRPLVQLNPRLIGCSTSGTISTMRPSSTRASNPQNAVQIVQNVLVVWLNA